MHIYPDETIRLENIDFLIQGEGEVAILEFLESLRGDRKYSDVSGLVYMENGKMFDNGISPKIENLDSISYPDRTFLPVEHYGSLLARGNRITTAFTSRGCPYRCTFCDRPMSPTISGFRWRSAKNVVDEMEECVDLGIKEILIYDDTFSVRKDRVYEMCDEILSRGIKVMWDVRAHVNTLDRDVLRAMKRAGCDRIHYGVESGNDRMIQSTWQRISSLIILTSLFFALTRRRRFMRLASPEELLKKTFGEIFPEVPVLVLSCRFGRKLSPARNCMI